MRPMRWLSLSILFASLLLAACGAAQSKSPVDVKISLKEFSVESSMMDFKLGVPYRFIVRNAGRIPHEFMIMPLAMPGMSVPEMQGMVMEERDRMALVMIPQEQLPAGATAVVDYTFEVAAAGGKLEIVCTLPGHLEAGMHTAMTIK